MEDPNQVSEQCLPDTELELVQKVDNHHLGNIKFLPRPFEPFAEGILWHAVNHTHWRWRKTSLTMVGTEDVNLSRASTRAPATA